MTEEQRNGKVCQYCDSPTSIKKLRYGSVAMCTNEKCGAYVSLNDIGEPKGCTAKSSLRKDRRKTHVLIDDLKYDKMRNGNVSEQKAIQKLYKFIETELKYDFEFKSLAQLNETENIELKIFLKKVIENVRKKREQRSKAKKLAS